MIEALKSIFLISTVKAAGLLSGVDAPTEISSVEKMVSRTYNIVAGMAGVVAFGAILYAAGLFFTSNGDPAKISKARMALTMALGGAALILLSRFVVVAFIKLFGGGVS